MSSPEAAPRSAELAPHNAAPIALRKPGVASALVCPDCRKALELAVDALRCGACGASFPVENGMPKLWPPSRAAALEKSVADFRAPRAGVRANRWLRALLPPHAVCDPGARARHARVMQAMAGGLVLNLGSKSARWGAHVVNLDLVLPLGETGASGDGVDMLADMERLPFADASVDGIICTYVLEHVADAQRCMGEMARVLKRGGMLYVTVPFLFPTHPDPLDRWRWTLDGLRYSLRDFEELEAGPSGGPFTAYVSIAPTLLASIFSNFYLFNAVRFALGWLLWPLKFLDYLAWRSTRSHMAAANFYFFGRRR